jgi:hypothetical protein
MDDRSSQSRCSPARSNACTNDVAWSVT